MLFGVVTSMLIAAAPATVSETQPPQNPEERKICRRDIETGSLIKGKKICMTAKQWQKISDDNRAEIESRVSSGSQSGK